MHLDKSAHYGKLWERKQLPTYITPSYGNGTCDHPMGTWNLASVKVVPPGDWQDAAASTAHDYHLLGLSLSLSPSLPPLNSDIHSSCLVPINRFCCSSKFKTQKEVNKDTHAQRTVWFASQQEQTDLLSTHDEARKYENNENHFSFIITKKKHLPLYTLQTTGKGNRCTTTAPG